MVQEVVKLLASIDLRKKTGQIMYVQPSSGANAPNKHLATAAGPGAAPRSANIDVVAFDALGTEVARVPADLQLSSCKPGEKPATAIVNQDILNVQGMHRLALEWDGRTIASFTAGASAVSVVVPEAPAGGKRRTMSLGPPMPGKPHHQALEVSGGVEPRTGITYTVQVDPDQSGKWNTIAVGAPTPKVDIDRHQFQGARKLRVRVLRSTGFADAVVAEEDLDLM